MVSVQLDAVVFDCPDDVALAHFYADLTGMTFEDNGRSFPAATDGICRLIFQQVDGYQPPTWPTQERGQQLHLELVTDDIPAAVSYAESLGARRAPYPPQDDYTVMLDPAGHPFCLCLPFLGLEEHAQRRAIIRDNGPTITVAGIDIDSPDLYEIVPFYVQWTGGSYTDADGGFPKIVLGNGLVLLFQPVEDYLPPSWPTQERGQQVHLDWVADDVKAEVARAIDLGGRLAPEQPIDHGRVMLDPAGHPFCILGGESPEA